MGKIMRNGNKYSSASPNNAQSVVYDNTDSGLKAENTKEAIDELNKNKVSFVDYANPFKSLNTLNETWIATQDCCIAGMISNPTGKEASKVSIDGVFVNVTYTIDTSTITGLNVYVKKGQTVKTYGVGPYDIKAYPLI